MDCGENEEGGFKYEQSRIVEEREK